MNDNIYISAVTHSFDETISISYDDVLYLHDDKKYISIPVYTYDELYRQQGLYHAEKNRANEAEEILALLKIEVTGLQENLQEAYKKIKNLT
jgi:hypothetical protein